LTQNPFSIGHKPVPISQARVEGIGVNPLDARRIDVAVDLTPCQQTLRLEMAIVGPDDQEWSSITIVHNRQWLIDKIMHFRRDALPGEYVLHVGLFDDQELVHHARKRFVVPPPQDP